MVLPRFFMFFFHVFHLVSRARVLPLRAQCDRSAHLQRDLAGARGGWHRLGVGGGSGRRGCFACSKVTLEAEKSRVLNGFSCDFPWFLMVFPLFFYGFSCFSYVFHGVCVCVFGILSPTFFPLLSSIFVPPGQPTCSF